MSDKDILVVIKTIRDANNLLWMRLLEIALQHASVETKAVLSQIKNNDRKISDLMESLSK